MASGRATLLRLRNSKTGIAKLNTKRTRPFTFDASRMRRRTATKPSAAMPKTGATTWRRIDIRAERYRFTAMPWTSNLAP